MSSNTKHPLEDEQSEDEPAAKKTALECSNPQENQSENTPTNSTESSKYFNGVEISKLSKRQLKKYNKLLKWQEMKKEKRVKERKKTKEKRLHAKLNNIDLGPSRRQLKQMKMKDSPCRIGVCIDLSFDDLMIDKDMAKTVKQILRVYTENRRAKAPMQLHLTSFKGRNKDEMAKHHGYENWDINFHTEDYTDVFPKDKLVYLSSESDHIITELEQDKVYIIGGLVDHNSHKGLCYKKAQEQGIAHGQLPIREYFWMNHRKVFTINQVFEILLRVSEGKSFKEAFEMILPKRLEMVPAGESDELISGDSSDLPQKMIPNKKSESNAASSVESSNGNMIFCKDTPVVSQDIPREEDRNHVNSSEANLNYMNKANT